jgi:hypothetical protein
MTCTHAPRLGAYALGIDDPERDAIEHHLTTCPDCRAELSDLAEVAAILTTAKSTGITDTDINNPHPTPHTQPDTQPTPAPTPDQDHQPTTPALPDDLLDRILTAIATERTHQTTKHTTPHNWRRRTTLTLAAAAVVAGSAIGVAVVHGDLLTPDQTQLAAGHSTHGVTAHTTIHDEPWGTRINMTLQDLPPLTTCRLIARAHNGHTETIASWHVTYNQGLDVEAMTKIHTNELAELHVIDTTGRHLITVPATPIERKPE